MKRFLAAALFLISGSVYAVQPGTNLIQPTQNSSIVQDLSGNMVFTDISTGPISLNKIVYPQTIGLAGTQTAISTLSVTGVNLTIPMVLAGPSAALPGSVLVATPTAPGSSVISCAVSTGIIDANNLIGVSNGSFAVGSTIPVVVNGMILALTTGTVVPGTVLVSSNSTCYGCLGANVNSVYGADFAVAMTSGPSVGGLTLVKIRK